MSQVGPSLSLLFSNIGSAGQPWQQEDAEMEKEKDSEKDKDSEKEKEDDEEEATWVVG